MADMLFTTHFMVLIMLTVWRTPVWCPILFYAVFAPIEGAYLSSVLLKVPTGMFPPDGIPPSPSPEPFRAFWGFTNAVGSMNLRRWAPRIQGEGPSVYLRDSKWNRVTALI